MKILIYGINFSPELTGTGKYTGEMAAWMSLHGHEIRVITAPAYYPEWKIHGNYSKYWYTKGSIDNVFIYRCPLYVPSTLTTVKRLVHLFSFAVTSFIPLLKQYRWRPDYILCVAPTLFCVPGLKLLSKITKSKSILHIQDYEVDAMIGLGMANKSFFTKLAVKFEHWCLHSVNNVSTISHSMVKKAIEKGVSSEKVIFFPNWSEVERFQNIDKKSITKIKDILSLPEGYKIILYSGNIGDKQGLESVIEVADQVQENNFLFLIVGHGGGKARLESLVSHKNLKNVIFKPLQSYDLLPALLKIADCHLVIQRKGAADSVLPSKLTNILAVGGNAVITADKTSELGQLCIEYPGIATLVEPESIDALLKGILSALDMPHENEIAKLYALNFLNKDLIIDRFLQEISL